MMTWQLVMLAFPLSLSLSLSKCGRSVMDEFTACRGGSRNHRTKTPPSLHPLNVCLVSDYYADSNSDCEGGAADRAVLVCGSGSAGMVEGSGGSLQSHFV